MSQYAMKRSVEDGRMTGLATEARRCAATGFRCQEGHPGEKSRPCPPRRLKAPARAARRHGPGASQTQGHQRTVEKTEAVRLKGYRK